MTSQHKPLPMLDFSTDMKAQRQQRLIWMGNLLRDAMELGRLRHYWIMDVETGAAYVTGRASTSGMLTELRLKWTGDGWTIEAQQADGKGWEGAKTPTIDLSVNALIGIAETIELELR